MMHRCSSNTVGQCTCGLFHTQTNSFTMLFSMPNNHPHNSYDETDMYPFPSSSSSSSSSVDCTLSLGTPSTRLCEDDDKRSICHDRRPTSCMSNFCWDILQNKNTPYSPQNHKTTARGSNTTTNSNSANNDPLLARRCANCDTTSTPLWRNGPRGPKSLCNACGIRFKKEERRATAANNASSNAGSTSSGTMEQHYAYQNNSWVQTQKMQCFSPANEFRFIEDSDRDSDTGIPFLSWRLNVTDRPSLVHDFTR
ncbi:GATA transcription factor 19 [Ricinus communis]|uniref:GATA transcription factor 19 n=1 Tax=Ricinus communis TaxID=3988 RepID=UPI0007725273|nr:GATA transcription factor 19 [Ricinus communis]|eukprot:XP_015576253.1 GATA transcription factor 19 [Ricinus communis]